LDFPACLLQRLVDMLAGLIFRSGHGRQGYLVTREKSPSREGELMAYSVWLMAFGRTAD
jgi:hypothetical protein